MVITSSAAVSPKQRALVKEELKKLGYTEVVINGNVFMPDDKRNDGFRPPKQPIIDATKKK
jgi:hypothetical protein